MPPRSTEWAGVNTRTGLAEAHLGCGVPCGRGGCEDELRGAGEGDGGGESASGTRANDGGTGGDENVAWKVDGDLAGPGCSVSSR